jgi:hypothetical protein
MLYLRHAAQLLRVFVLASASSTDHVDLARIAEFLASAPLAGDVPAGDGASQPGPISINSDLGRISAADFSWVGSNLNTIPPGSISASMSSHRSQEEISFPNATLRSGTLGSLRDGNQILRNASTAEASRGIWIIKAASRKGTAKSSPRFFLSVTNKPQKAISTSHSSFQSYSIGSETLRADNTLAASGVAAAFYEKHVRFKQFLDRHKNTDPYQSILDEIHREASRKWQQWILQSRAWSSADQRAYTAHRKVARQRTAEAKESLTLTSPRTHSTLGSVSRFSDITGTDA